MTPSASGHPCWRTPRPDPATTPRSAPASAGSCRFPLAPNQGCAVPFPEAPAGQADDLAPSRRTGLPAAGIRRCPPTHTTSAPPTSGAEISPVRCTADVTEDDWAELYYHSMYRLSPGAGFADGRAAVVS